jgi:hypothetical protein
MPNNTPRSLKIGINLPWVEYGWDFGMPPRNQRALPWTARGAIFNEHGGPQVLTDCKSPKRQSVPWLQDFNAFMDCFKCMGVDVVRWNLLGDCYTYGKTRFLSEGDWEVTDTELAPCFIEDFKECLGLCAAKAIKLLPTFIDHRAFWPGVQVVTACKHAPALSTVARKFRENPETWNKSKAVQSNLDPLRSGETDRFKGGRGDLLLDPASKDPFKAKRSKREGFFDKVIKQLLDAANSKPEYKQTIFAWDVLNEPELAFSVGKNMLNKGNQYGNGSDIYHGASELQYQPSEFSDWQPPFGLDDMRQFLLGAAELVCDAGFKWTVGFQRMESLTDSKLLPMKLEKKLEEKYLPQFHYYGSPAPLPALPTGWTNPCFLGEFALADPADMNEQWYEQAGGTAKKALSDRLQLLASAGYGLALGWSARGAEVGNDKRSAWNKSVCDEIAKQNGKSSCAECDRTFQAQQRIAKQMQEQALIMDEKCKKFPEPPDPNRLKAPRITGRPPFTFPR